MNNKIFIPKNFVLDVDGVMTDGQFHYSIDGKVMKIFGPDDADALSLIKDKVKIHFISGDKRGFAITQKRMEDMGFPLDQVSTFDRVQWIEEKYGLENTIYMGDGIYDSIVFKAIGYSIAPANAFYQTKKMADFVTESRGASGAVAEACFHIAEKFFTPINLLTYDFSSHESGAWSNKK
jgi:3-deoxy-D-manno-octulosonate 8-phosphate phosphatase (KDO 8-P phosphatase)